MIIDCYALMVQVARDPVAAEKLISKKIFENFQSQADAVTVSKKVMHRHQKGYHPQMQIDGTIEF